jgi:hypothetical protein
MLPSTKSTGGLEGGGGRAGGATAEGGAPGGGRASAEGDGYYECVVLDPDGNRVEVTA